MTSPRHLCETHNTPHSHPDHENLDTTHTHPVQQTHTHRGNNQNPPVHHSKNSPAYSQNIPATVTTIVDRTTKNTTPLPKRHFTGDNTDRVGQKRPTGATTSTTRILTIPIIHAPIATVTTVANRTIQSTTPIPDCHFLSNHTNWAGQICHTDGRGHHLSKVGQGHHPSNGQGPHPSIGQGRHTSNGQGCHPATTRDVTACMTW